MVEALLYLANFYKRSLMYRDAEAGLYSCRFECSCPIALETAWFGDSTLEPRNVISFKVFKKVLLSNGSTCAAYTEACCMRLLDFAGPAKQDAKALLREIHNLAGGVGGAGGAPAAGGRAAAAGGGGGGAGGGRGAT
jgi:uncharacterized membrane protein YgcG